MPQHVQITFRHVDPSPRLESLIQELADKLELARGATRFHVTVEGIRRPKSTLFQVFIDLALPGGALHVGQDAHLSRVGEDAYGAVRDAFQALRRQLQDLAMRRRGEVKVHAPGRGLRALSELESHPQGQEGRAERSSQGPKARSRAGGS